MKNKRLSTRVLAAFAAVLLITALSVPAFAATSYTVEGGEDGYGVVDFLLPEGTYNVEFRFEGDGQIISVPSYAPVEITYSSNIDFSYYFEGGILVTEADGTQVQPYLYICSLDGGSSIYRIVSDGVDFLMPGYFVVFTPVYESPSLTDYITADTPLNVLNEVISLLPIALGVIVGYIAIRKGISYLQSFLHNS